MPWMAQACHLSYLRDGGRRIKDSNLPGLQSKQKTSLGTLVRHCLKIQRAKMSVEGAQWQSACLACTKPLVQPPGP